MSALRSTIVTRFTATMTNSDFHPTPSFGPRGIATCVLYTTFLMGPGGSPRFLDLSLQSRRRLRPRWETLFGIHHLTSKCLLPAAGVTASAPTTCDFRGYHVHLTVSARLFRCLRFVAVIASRHARLARRLSGFSFRRRIFTCKIDQTSPGAPHLSQTTLMHRKILIKYELLKILNYF